VTTTADRPLEDAVFQDPVLKDQVRVDPAKPDSVRWLSETEQRNWRSFFYSAKLLLDAIDRDLLAEYGIPHGYYEVFVRLSEAEDRSMRMSELASITRSSRSRLSHAVARLEEKGWVERIVCETDRRGQVAHLTDDGMALLQRAAASHVESVRRYLVDPLSSTQLDELGTIGQIVYENLSDGESSPV
jgi:DNA-binding MarR family transcriptional regulator